MRQGLSMLYACLGFAAMLGLSAMMAADAAAADTDEHPVVVFDTTLGPISIELDRAKAPITVDNFLKYVDSGFFNGLTFHRVIPGFMIQGGGLTDQMREKTEGQLAPIKNESSNGLTNARGTISMARTNDPDSATSQFFISVVDNKRALDPRPGSAGYAVFGKVIAGMDVGDGIAKVETGQRGPHGDVPLKPIYIKSAKRKAKS
jgi:peptidyl-prolyl cis-trans isomerase A (cyclophilin A)